MTPAERRQRDLIRQRARNALILIAMRRKSGPMKHKTEPKRGAQRKLTPEDHDR